jgi:TldD protein
VNIVADKLQPGSLGYVGYDDEGVKTKKWDLIRDGKLVGYQAIRDQAHIEGKTASTAAAMRTAGPTSSSSAWPTSRWKPARTR